MHWSRQQLFFTENLKFKKAENSQMFQVIRSPKQYDVCIIGSGAGGGTAAKVLTEGGLNCVMLEAGPDVHPEKDFKMFMWPYESAHRGAGVGGHARENFGEFLAPNGAWHIEGEPYTSAPGSDFQWFRSRIVGGRTNHWGRIALRFAPIDFKSKCSRIFRISATCTPPELGGGKPRISYPL